jgi:hypothetical protein
MTLFTFRAAVPALEREVTLTVQNEPISIVLIKIQEQTGVVFSYPSSLISSVSPVSVSVKQKTIREVLSLILPQSLYYKPKDNYIILKEKKTEKNPAKTELSGYVIDKSTNKKIANVTVYDKNTLKSTTTDDYGFYSLTVPAASNKISINKQDYKDTALILTGNNNALYTIGLDPLSDSIKTKNREWEKKLEQIEKFTEDFVKKFGAYINTLNVKDTLTRPFQVSLLPFIGTNHKLSGNIYNNFSFNVLGGYSKGNNAFELAGLFNINKEHVKGVQIGGLFNANGGKMTGVQIGGLFNAVGQETKGVQIAGLFNNNNGNSKGVAIAGLMNLTKDTTSGISIAGLFNRSRHLKNGIQIAGLYNDAESGSANVQIAGLFNKTKVLTGVQIATFNFADSASGVPIGFFSFVKKGVHQIEISADELFYTNLSFRTGANSFYNVFSGGIEPGKSEPMWHLGYGIGTSFGIIKKLRSDITVSTQHLCIGEFSFSTNDLYKFYWGLEYKFNRKLSVAAGATFNLLLTDLNDPENALKYQSRIPSGATELNDGGNNSVKWWPGARVAIRFL